jgi:hypothetical protein
MHILAEEVLRLKELVDEAHRVINGPSPDITGSSKLLAEASKFLDEIVQEQPRPVRTDRPG